MSVKEKLFVMSTKRYGHVDSNESARCDHKQCLAIPPANPVQDKKSRDFGRNFNSTINEMCQVHIDAKA